MLKINRSQNNTLFLWLLIFSIGMQKISIGPLKVVDLFIIIIFVFLLFQGNLLVVSNAYVFFGMILTLQMISLFFSKDLSWSFKEIIRNILCYLELIVLVSLFNKNNKNYLKIVINAGTVYILLSLFFYFIQIIGYIPKIVTHGRTRLEGFMLDPNYFSIFVIIISILLNFIRHQYKTKWYLFIAGVLCLSVLLARSRSMMVLFVIFFIMSFYFFNKVTLRNVLLIIFLILISTLVIAYTTVLESITKRFTTGAGINLSEDIRFEIWGNGIEALLAQPFGYGPGMYRFATEPFGGTGHDAHNTYFWISVNNGLHVLLIIFILLAYFYILKKREYKEKYSILILLFFLAASITFSLDTFRASWVLISVLVFRLYNNKKMVIE